MRPHGPRDQSRKEGFSQQAWTYEFLNMMQVNPVTLALSVLVLTGVTTESSYKLNSIVFEGFGYFQVEETRVALSIYSLNYGLSTISLFTKL